MAFIVATLVQVLILMPTLSLGAGLGAASSCPVKQCSSGKGTSFQQLQAPIESATPCEEVSNFEVSFLPGHFVCTKCDSSACKDCGVLCDLSSCMGQFFSQECWCEGSSGGHEVAFCDSRCSDGLCGEKDKICRPKSKACDPWWWCDSEPPVNLAQRSTARLRSRAGQKTLSVAQQSKAQSQSQSSEKLQSAVQRLDVARQQAKQRAESRRTSQQQKALMNATLPAELSSLSFSDGRFECFSGALPPKTKDAEGFFWIERGYIVLDAATCTGAQYNHKCYCWDNYKRLKGEDPLTSEVQCDDSCGMGLCEGRTCSSQPPSVVVAKVQASQNGSEHQTEQTMKVETEALDD